MPVSFSELLDAFEFASLGQLGESQAFVNRRTGKIHYRSDYTDEEEDLPDDIDGEDYVEVPQKRDLGLGKRTALDFAREFMASDFDGVREIFSRKGAYGRFKDLLDRRGKLESWYEFSNNAEEAALRAWCEDCELELSD